MKVANIKMWITRMKPQDNIVMCLENLLGTVEQLLSNSDPLTDIRI